MTPAAIVWTLQTRGARLLLFDGDRLAVAPRSALDDELREAIRHQKPALLMLMRTGEIELFDPQTTRAYLAASTRTQDERFALERLCDALAVDPTKADVFRATVRELVEHARRVRAEYGAETGSF